MSFIEYIEKYKEVKKNLDIIIWPVFNKYAKDMKCKISNPKDWTINNDRSITIFGDDCWRGYCENTSIEIDFDFFLNYEKALIKKKEELNKKIEEQKIKEEKLLLEIERKEFERLKKKFSDN